MSNILSFSQFVSENNHMKPEDYHRMKDLGVGELKKFKNYFEVLDFFGGSLPQVFHRAKEAAEAQGYELTLREWDEALMASMDGESEEGVYEENSAELAAKKAAIEQEEANVAKAKADLAAKKAQIKPEDPNALQLKANAEAEEAKLSQQEADIAKRKDAISKTVVTQ